VTAPVRPRRILVIEGDGPTRALIAEVLTEDGHEITLEWSGMTGRDRAMTGAFDLVLCEIQLPELDGIALVKHLRAAGLRTRVVALTADAGDAERRDALAAGFDEYLFKPIKASALSAEIAAQLRAQPITLPPRRPRGVLGGLVVVAMGIPFILQPLGVPNAASYLFVAMGAAFLRGHQYVYLIPMVTLTSFGVALLLPTWVVLRPETVAPAFVGVIALGFLVAFGLAPERRWPLIPSALLGAVAAARLITGSSPIPAALEPYLVPVVLVGVGLYLLIEPQDP
jgi:CheY-like chemotaxis protein